MGPTGLSRFDRFSSVSRSSDPSGNNSEATDK